MAHYRLDMDNGKIGSGLPHATYINREGKYEKHKSEQELVYKESGNLPEWATENPNDFWEAADTFERSGEILSGRSYRKIDLALPAELNLEQHINITKEFVDKTLGNDFVYSLAIHYKKAAFDDRQDQPHVHIMFSERRLDGISRSKEQFFKRANSKNPELGGTKKDRNWIPKAKLYQLRKQWEDIQNEHFEKLGLDVRVDCRTLKEQKEEALAKGDFEKARQLDREAELHLGPIQANKTAKALNAFYAENPEKDRKELREIYMMEYEENPRVKYSFIMREIREITQEIALEIQRKKAEEYEEILDIETIAVTKEDVIKEVDKRLIELNQEQEKIIRSYDLAIKEVIPERRAMAMATARHFNGSVKVITDDLKSNEKSISLVNQEIRTFNEKPKPSVLNVKAKTEYDKERKALLLKSTELINKKNSLIERKEKIENDLKDPNIQAKINTIKDAILDRNEPKREQAASLYSDRKIVQNQIRELTKLKYVLNKTPFEKVVIPKAQYSTTNVTKEAIKIVDKMTATTNVHSNLKAKIDHDIEDDYGRYQ